MTFKKKLELGTLLALSESSFLQKATSFEARFRDGYPEPRFTFWRPARGGAGGWGKASGGQRARPVGIPPPKDAPNGPRPRPIWAPHSGQGFVPPSVRNAVQARSTTAFFATRGLLFAIATPKIGLN